MSTSQAGDSSSRTLLKSIVQGTGIYSLALLAQRVGGFVMLPIVTRGLSTAEYGVSGVLEQISTVLSLLLGSGLAWSMGYFYFRAESDQGRRNVVGTILTGSVILGVLVALACWPLAGFISRRIFKSDIEANYLRLLLAGMPVGFVLEALSEWVRLDNRPGVYLWSSLARLGVTIAGIVVFLGYLRLHVWGILFSSQIAMAITALLLLVYCFRKFRPGFEMRLVPKIARFSLPVGIGAIGAFVVNFGDQLILPSYVSRSEVGTYVLAYKIGMLIYAFAYSPFHIYWSAQIYGIMKREDARIVFARIFTYLAAGLSFCAVGLLGFSVPLLRILPPDYRHAAPIIPIIVAAYCLRAVGEFVRMLFLTEGHPAYDAATNWIGSGLCLVGYLGLIPVSGIWGAAIATLASFAMISLISFVWAYHLRPYSLEPVRLGKIAIAATAAVGVLFVSPAWTFSIEVVRALASLALFAAVLFLLRFFTPGESDILRASLSQISVRLAGRR